MVRTFLKVYMELCSYFLFLQEQIKDIIIKQGKLTEFGKAPGLRSPRMKMRGWRRKQARTAVETPPSLAVEASPSDSTLSEQASQSELEAATAATAAKVASATTVAQAMLAVRAAWQQDQKNNSGSAGLG